jgi:hypothetical protein
MIISCNNIAWFIIKPIWLLKLNFTHWLIEILKPTIKDHELLFNLCSIKCWIVTLKKKAAMYYTQMDKENIPWSLWKVLHNPWSTEVKPEIFSLLVCVASYSKKRKKERKKITMNLLHWDQVAKSLFILTKYMLNAASYLLIFKKFYQADIGRNAKTF